MHLPLLALLLSARVSAQDKVFEVPAEPTLDDNGVHTYRFKYYVHDGKTGDYKTQEEISENGVVRGTYSVGEPNGDLRVVSYTAGDGRGFQAMVRVQPTAVPLPAPESASNPTAVAEESSADRRPEEHKAEDSGPLKIELLQEQHKQQFLDQIRGFFPPAAPRKSNRSEQLHDQVTEQLRQARREAQVQQQDVAQREAQVQQQDVARREAQVQQQDVARREAQVQQLDVARREAQVQQQDVARREAQVQQQDVARREAQVQQQDVARREAEVQQQVDTRLEAEQVQQQDVRQIEQQAEQQVQQQNVQVKHQGVPQIDQQDEQQVDQQNVHVKQQDVQQVKQQNVKQVEQQEVPQVEQPDVSQDKQQDSQLEVEESCEQQLSADAPAPATEQPRENDTTPAAHAAHVPHVLQAAYWPFPLPYHPAYFLPPALFHVVPVPQASPTGPSETSASQQS